MAKKKDAIQDDETKDVSVVDPAGTKDDTNEDAPEFGMFNESRKDLYNYIASHVDEEREKELGIGEGDLDRGDDDTDTDKDVDDTDGTKDTEDNPDDEPNKPEKPDETDDELDTLVIDGVEQKVKKSDIYETGKRAKQKEIAADKRLEEASKLKKEIDAEREQFEAWKKSQQAPPKKEEPKINHELELAKSDLIEAQRAFAKATSDLDEEGILDSQAKISDAQFKVWKIETAGQSQKPIDVDGIEKTIMSKIQAQETLRQIERPFEDGGMRDLIDDPYKQTLMTMEVNRLIQSGEDGLKFATYQKAAARVRDWLTQNNVSTASNKADEKETQDKIDKKRKLEVVKGVNSKPPDTKKKDEINTPEDVINEGMKELVRRRIK
jgi:hypothetical protein